MASLVPEGGRLASAGLFGSTHAARCVSIRLWTTVRIHALRGRTFVERVATADYRALPPMKSGSNSTLNERGAITKDTMCAERFSEKCEENTCQVTSLLHVAQWCRKLRDETGKVWR